MAKTLISDKHKPQHSYCLLFSCFRCVHRSVIIVLPSWNRIYKSVMCPPLTEIHLWSVRAPVSSQMSSRPPWTFHKGWNSSDSSWRHTATWPPRYLCRSLTRGTCAFWGARGVRCEFGIDNACNPVLIKSDWRDELTAHECTPGRGVCVCVCVREWETTGWGIYTIALGCWLINVILFNWMSAPFFFSEEGFSLCIKADQTLCSNLPPLCQTEIFLGSHESLNNTLSGFKLL